MSMPTRSKRSSSDASAVTTSMPCALATTQPERQPSTPAMRGDPVAFDACCTSGIMRARRRVVHVGAGTPTPRSPLWHNGARAVRRHPSRSAVAPAARALAVNILVVASATTEMLDLWFGKRSYVRRTRREFSTERNQRMTKAGLLEAVMTSGSVDHADTARRLDGSFVTMMSLHRTRRRIVRSHCSGTAARTRAGRSPLTSGPARDLVTSPGASNRAGDRVEAVH